MACKVSLRPCPTRDDAVEVPARFLGATEMDYTGQVPPVWKHALQSARWMLIEAEYAALTPVTRCSTAPLGSAITVQTEHEHDSE